MSSLVQSPFFGILISLIAFEIALWIQRKTHLLILNPLLVSIIFVMLFLFLNKIELTDYQVGGSIINMFLGPATVVLAVPLYQQMNSLKNYLMPILLGVLIGSIVGMLSILLCGWLMNFDNQILASLLPKSVTTPIGIEISTQLGGIPSITVLNILITGILGTVISEFTLKFFKIDNAVAKGIAIGTSSHAVGTSKALQMGRIEGAMSSLAIGVAGLMTVFIAPLLWNIILPLVS